MKQSKAEFKIGITVIIAIILLIMGVLWGKRVSLSAGKYQVYVHFTDVIGLDKGSAVMVNGIRRGEVDELMLQKEGVLVGVSLQQNVRLFTDARFEITNPELMSGKVVNIFPGLSGIEPEEGHIFHGETGSGMNELMKMSADLVDDVQHLLVVLEETVENINKTAGDPKLREAFVSSVNNLDESSQRTLEIITLNEDKLTQVMDNLVRSTEMIRGVLEDHADKIDRSITDFEQFTSKLNETADQLHLITTQLQSENGTLGLLLNDEEFAGSLRQTLTNLDSLIVQIREEGIQTNVSLFGRRKR
jgi:phospholipid/cholesterol/gamma-HCH transport system substrate-binding protein